MTSLRIHEALTESTNRLGGVSETPALDAQWMLLRIIGKEEASWIYAHGEAGLTDEQGRELEKFVEERAAGKPLAYIFGEWEFYGRNFRVNENVLIPRPDTEDLVQAALAYLRDKLCQADKLVVADLGTGSGCVVITLALELANLEPAGKNINFLATDISLAALKMARENARRFGVEDRIEFRLENMTTTLRASEIDFIASNPPYVPSAELALAGQSLATAGLQFEPEAALDGGPDGKHYLRQIVASGIPALVEGVGGKIERLNLT